MKEYQAVKAGGIEILNKKVNDLLVEGWELYGNIACSNCKEGNLYCQALVREKRSGNADVSMSG